MNINSNYQNNNKIYIPNQYYDINYKYILENNNMITIITNSNCYQNYNTTYCDCIKYNIEYNILTNIYQCNANTTSNIISHNYITTDINNSVKIRKDYVQDYTIYFGVLIIAILLTQLFKKNSRRI